MRGVIFTEFIEMVEAEFGIVIADEILTNSDLASGGAYTAVGNYDHQEMLRMVAALSRITGAPEPDLARALGKYLFKSFVVLYPHLFVGIGTAFDMLARIDGYIHIEVRKLYGESELPRILYETSPSGAVQITYRSARPFADVAEGLIQGCVAHFGERVEIARAADDGGQNTHAVFVLKKLPVAEAAAPIAQHR